MRVYENVFILRPDVPEEDVDKFITQMDSVVTTHGGKVQKTDKWGRRRLAYEVRGNRDGQYVVFTIECEPPVIREFERVLKVSEPVIKFLTVRIDEELKRLDKMRLKREKRDKRRAGRAPASHAPSPEQAAG